MLKQAGFSLLELLISLALSPIILLSAVAVYQPLQKGLIDYYQQFRLEQVIEHGLFDLSKEIKRAGFTVDIPNTIKSPAIVINPLGDCIVLYYDSQLQGNGSPQSAQSKALNTFAYRHNHHNIEYKSGTNACQSSQWEKLFDPNEIIISHFKLRKRHQTIEIELKAEWKNAPTIDYQVTKVIRYENEAD